MSEPKPNAEDINDRVKLLFHRLIARRLKEDPSLLDKAREDLARQRARFGDRDQFAEWEDLLDQGVDVVRREIVRRTERMTRLRISSPLGFVMDFRDEAFRRRVWRSSRDALTRRLAPAQSSSTASVTMEVIPAADTSVFTETGAFLSEISLTAFAEGMKNDKPTDALKATMALSKSIRQA